MSYDLWFRAPGSPPTLDELVAYFSAQPHVEVRENQAFYRHPDTGVYGSFDLDDRGDDRVCAFNLNYFRPHVFGLELEPLLTAFVGHFALGVEDPQGDGMGSGPYSPEGFLRGWNAGNAFAHEAILAHQAPDALFSQPRARLEAVWNWNLRREQLQASFEVLLEPGFVPTLMYLVLPECPDRVTVCAVWGDAMPLALPDVADQVILLGEGIDVPRHVAVDAVRPLLQDYPRIAPGSSHPTGLSLLS
ncbi:MAG: hypothetical protein R3F62_32145, partial [Planctomycetota bacterium]